MKERPILFSSPMVNAILAGRKTMTRRLLKTQPPPMEAETELEFRRLHPILCHLGAPGERLWVRETFAVGIGDKPFYKADLVVSEPYIWKPSIFMPRKYSRILLEITNIRVERLQEITIEDVFKEGIVNTGIGFAYDSFMGDITPRPKEEFRKLWESINGPGSWADNPFVWVIEFRRVK